MSDKIVIPMEELGMYGVSVHAKTILDTDENRFALRCKDGACVTITQAPSHHAGYWQEAHSHSATRELYFIWKGILVLVACLDEENVILHSYKNGEFFSCEPGVAHAVFVVSETVFGTTKFQLPGFEFPDYHPEPEMDARVRAMRPDVLRGFLCDTVV